MKLNSYFHAALVLGLAGACHAATIGAVTLTPASTAAGMAATVTVTAVILDPTVIASSVNLQQLDAQGRVVKVVGTMVDDGTGGDAHARDRIFSIRFTLLEQKPAALTYRVSAGVLGSLIRIFSSPAPFSVSGTVTTGIAILQPANLMFTNISPTIIAGTIGDPGATVQVNGIAAVKSGTTFRASVPLQEGNNPITAVATNSNGTSSTAAIQVTLDTAPPHVTVDSPPAGFATSEATVTVSGIVNDIVVGTVNQDQATVTVNGAAARVANRRYTIPGVPLTVGNNTLQIVARDQTGNSATTSISVMRQAPAAQSIQLVSGNNQTGTVGKPLPAPLVVQLRNGASPVPNAPVIFKVTGNDGVLMPGNGKQQLIAVSTDSQGQARATLTLGHRAGAGSNTIQAYAAGFQGVALFTADGTAQAAAKINMDLGSSQFGAIGQALERPFVAVVSDAANNRLAGVAVTFTVKQGGGNLGGQSTVQSNTDGDGRALAVLTLGSEAGQDNNLVEANFAGNPGLPARFIASAKVPGNSALTSISGVVLDNSNNPVAGVTMRLFLANQGASNNQPVQVGTPIPTNALGLFTIKPAPVGLFKLMADGSTATQAGKAYPTLEYDLVTVAGQDNSVGMPIYLPTLDPAARLCVSPTAGGELKPPSSPGLSLNIQPNAATFSGGGKSGCVSVSPVNPDKIPMTPGFGAQPKFFVTIQPVGTTFNPPAAISTPNLDGLPPNAKTEMFSYDHDLSEFVVIGTGTVTADGSQVASDPGVGVLKAGWLGIPLPGPTGGAAPVTVKIKESLRGVDRLLAIGQDGLEVASFTAAGGPAGGTYQWSSSNPSIVKVASPSAAATKVTANNLGKTTLKVRFTSATADASGTFPSAEDSVDVIVYRVSFVEFTPAPDPTIYKPFPSNPDFPEIDQAFDVSVKIDAGGATSDVHPSQIVRFTFEDPDDPSNDTVIDPNGAAGDDNASIAAGGRRTAKMWLPASAPAEPSNVTVSDDGQTATASSIGVAIGEIEKIRVTFRSSPIAGDNYVLKAEVINFPDDGPNMVLSKTRTGTISVRKRLNITNAIQMSDGADVVALMANSEIGPPFLDADTDYTGPKSATNFPDGPNSPEFLLPEIDPPNADEMPTDDERARFKSTDPAIKQAAQTALEIKATIWVRRNYVLKLQAEEDFAKRVGAIEHTVIGVRAFSPKDDGNPNTGQTNFYPKGLTVPSLVSPNAPEFDPNGDWGLPPVDVDVAGGIIWIPSTVAPSQQLTNLLRNAVGHLSDHVLFGTGGSDDAELGLMAAGAPSGSLSEDSILKLRGYKKNP